MSYIPHGSKEVREAVVISLLTAVATELVTLAFDVMREKMNPKKEERK